MSTLTPPQPAPVWNHSAEDILRLTKEAIERDRAVQDKVGALEFVAPGREDVFAEFVLDEAVLDELRADTAGGEKCLRWFDVDVATASGEVVAKVRKQLYVRRKRDR